MHKTELQVLESAGVEAWMAEVGDRVVAIVCGVCTYVCTEEAVLVRCEMLQDVACP